MIKHIDKEKIFELIKKDYRFWADENCILRGTEFLEIVFYAKYHGINNCWEFWLEKTTGDYDYLRTRNVGGFEYCFPLQ